MGAIGKRSTTVDFMQEPTLMGDIKSIWLAAEREGYVGISGRLDIEGFVRSKGINLIYEDLESQLSGYLKCVLSVWTIGVNSKHNPKRQRFTIAHEYAHFVLHKSDEGYFEDYVLFRKDYSSSIEFAANRFAAELLMPRDKIQNMIDGHKSELEIASAFDVSLVAAKYRLENLKD